jgi:hypothetical protein
MYLVPPLEYLADKAFEARVASLLLALKNTKEELIPALGLASHLIEPVEGPLKIPIDGNVGSRENIL